MPSIITNNTINNNPQPLSTDNKQISTHNKLKKEITTAMPTMAKASQVSSSGQTISNQAEIEKKSIQKTTLSTTDITRDNIDSALANWKNTISNSSGEAIINRYLYFVDFAILSQDGPHNIDTIDDKISELLNSLDSTELRQLATKIYKKPDIITDLGELAHKNLQTLVQKSLTDVEMKEVSRDVDFFVQRLNTLPVTQLDNEYFCLLASVDMGLGDITDELLSQKLAEALQRLDKTQLESISEHLTLAAQDKKNEFKFSNELTALVNEALFQKQDAFINSEIQQFVAQLATTSLTQIDNCYENLIRDTIFDVQESKYGGQQAYIIIDNKLEAQLQHLSSAELTQINQRLLASPTALNIQPIVEKSIRVRITLESVLDKKIDNLFNVLKQKNTNNILKIYQDVSNFVKQNPALNQHNIKQQLEEKLKETDKYSLANMVKVFRALDTSHLTSDQKENLTLLEQTVVKHFCVHTKSCNDLFIEIKNQSNHQQADMTPVHTKLNALIAMMSKFGLTNIHADLSDIMGLYTQKSAHKIEELTLMHDFLKKESQQVSSTQSKSSTEYLEAISIVINQQVNAKGIQIKQLDTRINTQIEKLAQNMKKGTTDAIFPILTSLHNDIELLSKIDPTIKPDAELLRRFDNEALLWEREDIASIIMPLIKFQQNGTIPDANKHDFSLIYQRTRQHFLIHSKTMERVFDSINFNDPNDLSKVALIDKSLAGMSKLMNRLGFNDINTQFGAITELYIQKNKLSASQVKNLNQQLLNIVEHERSQQKALRFSGYNIKDKEIEIGTINMPLRAFARGVRSQVINKMANDFNDKTITAPMTPLGTGYIHTVYSTQYTNNDTPQIKVYKQDDENITIGRAPSLAIGIDNSSPRLLERAVIASKIDQKLGFNVLVKTDFATHNGELGLVMDESSGVNAKKAQFNPNDYKYKASLQQQLTQLHLVDIITGQVDRHGDNYMLYVDPITEKVVVKGIDNDFCLGPDWNTLQQQTREINSQLQDFPNVVDTKMKAAIEALTDNDIEELSGGFLSNAAIEATKTRLAKLKSHLNALEAEGKIVSPHLWGKAKVNNLIEYGEHIVFEKENNDQRIIYTSYWARDIEMLEDNFSQYQNAARNYNYA